MRLTIVAAAVLALAGTASATVRKVPQDYLTIDAAASAAQTGDTIVVSKGRYTIDATITFSDPNLIIKGSGAIIDGARPNQNDWDINPFYFDSNADGCTVTGFIFRNGDNAIYSDGENLTVTKCTFIDTSSQAIYSNSGDNLTVTGCKFFGCYVAVYGNSTQNVRISKCVVRSTDEEGFDVNNDGARLESNTISYTSDQEGIYVSGANAVILKNKVFNTDGEGIEVDGNDAKVSGNTVKKVDGTTGIDVEGDRAVVEKNKTTDTGGGIAVYASSNLIKVTVIGNKCTDFHSDYGIEVGADLMVATGNAVTLGSDDADGFYFQSYTDPAAAGATNGLIENNKASECIRSGMEMDSIYNVTVRNCSVTNCGSQDDEGFYIDGNDNVLEGLKVSGIDNTGIYHNSGNNNVYTKCSVVNVYGDGYRVYGDNNDFVNCTAANCGGEGFDNRGGVTTATELKGGKYRGDRNDVANDTANSAQITLDAAVDAAPGTPQSEVD